MRRGVTIACLVAWLAVTAAALATFVASRGEGTDAALLALSTVCAPTAAVGLGAVLGCALVLAREVELGRWAHRALVALAVAMVAWIASSFFALPAFERGIPLPTFTLAVAFHAFPVLLVLLGFGCGVATAPVRAGQRRRRRLRLASPFSADEAPRRNAWRPEGERNDAGDGPAPRPRA